MTYPKQFMTISELVSMGLKKKDLYRIAQSRHQKIARKIGTGGRTSSYIFDTVELEKYLRASCTGI